MSPTQPPPALSAPGARARPPAPAGGAVAGARVWRCGERRLSLARPLLMGIVNVTPDSFSDGGRWDRPEAAVEHALRLAREGADMLDIGGESTRPGAAPVPYEDERSRVVPVIGELARQCDLPLSVDTRKAAVAAEALAAGACIVNDVSAGGDPAMAAVVRRAGAGLVLMHMRGDPRTMQQDPVYADVVAEVGAWLEARARELRAAGLPADSLALDPGIGFGKTTAHNLALLAALPRLAARGWPVVVGLSRKRWLGELTGAPVGERLAGSLCGLLWCAWQGASVLRVHDVAASAQALRVAEELSRERARQERAGATRAEASRVDQP